MQYHAVNGRCAVDLKSFTFPISELEALALLYQRGFKIINVDIIALARECIIKSKYRRGARPSEAPAIVDCSSFTKWLYAMRGIWLPRRSIQQRELGEHIRLDSLVAGDLVFVSGLIDYYDKDPKDGVGHIGIATGEESIIHAANKKANVVESTLESFVDKDKFRGARRYIQKGVKVFTLLTPPEREVEMADDIRWIILQSLPKK